MRALLAGIAIAAGSASYEGASLVAATHELAAIRDLAIEPSILLADEPTGNLDSTTSGEIMALFDELNRSGNTVILVTHEDDIAEHAHRTVVLRDGKIISDQ